jgi:predicted CoA-binding protein
VAGYVEPSEDELRAIYADTATIAVVGASANPAKPAHTIPAYLREVGFRIVPVNPAAEEVLGVTAYPRLEEVPVPVDVVEVFRPAVEAPEIARSAVAIRAKVLWLQEGIVSEEAAAIARAGGLRVVMDRCMGVTHRALFG